ncbi:protease HtpX [bacterium endosymbiont of Pedicinus badii]|uniref:protease HtpX n=1 Tax=bacterium endosymbiont of Pedicinus badii TaxID=1719126 RepID=UPI0009BBBCB0|nr:protease HtpX [bacterium endosymbiont of Pedicinus badii]OQM34423.1 heat-shock protein HtpX [bacterium endosymbiont of Pedicinus badii]
MLRIAIFLLTNFSILLTLGMILQFSGFQKSNILSLLIISGIFGFGGSIVSLVLSKYLSLKSVSGRIIKKITNQEENWLFKTISKHAKIVNIKTPKIAIYPSMEINAFATGISKDNSLIAVSQGLIDNMNEKEKEAVLAHEISHISNGDMVTMTLLQGVLNTFVFFFSRILAQIVYSIFQNSKNCKEEKPQNSFLYFVFCMILETILGIFASVIVFWFSRNREFYADAGSAKIVGKKNMISALEKLKSSISPKEPNHVQAFCINGKKTNSNILTKLFLSHPSLEKRIKALLMEKYF